MMSSINEWIIPKIALIGIFFVFAVLIAFEILFSEIIKDFSVEKECSCTFKEYGEHNGFFVLKLNCEGKEGYARDYELVSRYLNNPRSLSEKCVLYESGEIVLKK